MGLARSIVSVFIDNFKFYTVTGGIKSNAFLWPEMQPFRIPRIRIVLVHLQNILKDLDL